MRTFFRLLNVYGWLYLAVLFVLLTATPLGAALAQDAEPLPEPQALFTIEATLNGAQAPTTRFVMEGEEAVARCRALADPANPLYAEAVALWIEGYRIVRPEGTGTMGPIHCNGYTVSPINDEAPGVPFGPPPAQ